ncbi:hypothetical protein G9A89_003195 [Geosiphon pyriformis]|nr:hypothetical protein G9A89_003195 [Geosiphon pyriformis]
MEKLDRKQKQLYTTYLVFELEKIKESLAHRTKLPKTGEWTLDNAQKKQLDLKNPYGNYNQKTFNKEAMRQVEKFIGRNNLTLHYKTACQLYVAFQYCSNILLDRSLKKIIVNNIGQMTNQQFKDLQKAIVNITIKHYTNEVLSTDITDFARA